MRKKLPWVQSLIFLAGLGISSSGFAQNQTDTLSPVLSSNGVPFSIQIQQAGFSLPNGLQSFVVGTAHGKWLLLAGRINGLHGFDLSNSNFPPDTQNTTVFVVDPELQTVVSRSLTNADSGLTQTQIDILSATGVQSYQSGHILYMTGGYGVDTVTTNFTTKAALTAIDVPGLMHWVTHPGNGETAAQHIRQVFDPMFQITGGVMLEAAPHHAMLAFGQDFEGPVTPTSTGTYSGQIRRFRIIEHGKHLSVVAQNTLPPDPDPNYARAQLNVVPIVEGNRKGFIAFSGVFTPGFGVWTVPVEITRAGVATMADPAAPETFRQGMNNFACPTLELYSHKNGDAYTVLMGGISYGFFQDGVFETDAELPFINQVTTIKRDRNGVFSQYLMSGEYPVIASTESNPGNTLLFGAGAVLIPAGKLPRYGNGVLRLDHLPRKPLLVGYIVGGIQSTLPNTSTAADSAASPYIFTVTVTPNAP